MGKKPVKKDKVLPVPTADSVLAVLTLEPQELGKVSKLFTVTEGADGSDFDDAIEQLRFAAKIVIDQTAKPWTVFLETEEVPEPEDDQEPEPEPPDEGQDEQAPEPPEEVGGAEPIDISNMDEEEGSTLPDPNEAEQEDCPDETPKDEKARRDADDNGIKVYEELLAKVRDQKVMLAASFGRDLVEHLRYQVAYTERKIWGIEKVSTEYPIIKAQREATLELLEWLEAPVKKFNDHVSGLSGTLFGEYVKHTVSICPETYLISITGDEDSSES